MQKKLNNQYLLALGSGICMGLTVAPVGAWFLAWVALSPLWVFMGKSKGRESITLPLLWGIGYHGLALFWITGIYPMTWLGVPWLPGLAITCFCWSFVSLWGGLLVTAWAGCMVRLQRQHFATRILLGTGIWCALEAIWSAGPLWWSSLSYTQSPHNLVILHLGQLSGPSAVTAVIVAVNGIIAEGWNRRNLAIATGLLVTCHLLGLILYLQPIAQPPAAALKIGIVQGNIPNQIKLLPEGIRRALSGYTSGYVTLAKQGVVGVLTPEGALPVFQRDLSNTSLVAAVGKQGVVAWVGAFGQQGRSYTNSLFTVAGDGEIVSHYDKVKLVPLGEYIPFEGILGGIINRLSPLDEHQVPGNPHQLFDTPLGRAIAVICYESAFPQQVRYQAAAGGQFILSASNDAHYSAPMPAQHHAQDIMRAIESDRWGVRATNTGYSGFVDPHGRTLWISKINTYQTHAETIYRRNTKTLYVRWGDWLTPVLLALGCLGGLVISWVESRHFQRF